MKFIALILIITGLFLATGYVCADDTQYPDLTGTWERQYIISDSILNDVQEINETIEGDGSWIIENQTGPIFDGVKVFSHAMTGKSIEKPFQAIITDDGDKFYSLGDTTGTGINLDFGEITDPDTIVVYHLAEGYTENNTFVNDPVAMKYVYKRVSNDTS